MRILVASFVRFILRMKDIAARSAWGSITAECGPLMEGNVIATIARDALPFMLPLKPEPPKLEAFPTLPQART